MASDKITDHAAELTAFFNAHRGTPTSIEFYPSSSPLLTSGPNIAIPKSYLVGAFTTAFATFNSLHPLPKWSPEDAQSLLDATLILILVAAEHTTAVNTRRRILIKGFRAGGEELVTPGDEMKLLEGILTSQLAKHNKSPSLWYYRRWIVERYGMEALGEGGLKGELHVIARSGEAHPRNYYAWNYARSVVGRFYTLCPEKAPLLRDLVEKQALLCMTHVSDTSFWSFLLFLFFKTLGRGEGSGPSNGNSSREEYIFGVTKEVMVLAHGIVKGHESVWVFVRTILADEELLEEAERKELIGIVESWVEGGVRSSAAGNEGVKERELEKKALEWISRRNINKYPEAPPITPNK